MHPMLNIAVRAARVAGNVILRYCDRVDSLRVSEKSRNDFVTEVDRLCEQGIIDTILKAYPDHAILAEESGQHNDSDFVWIVDPLDGTTNFVHGFPQFAVSIALRQKSRLEQAVVYDPLREELYTATRGEGAKLNDRRLRVSGRRSLKGALLGTGIPYHDLSLLDIHQRTLRALIPDTAGIRRPGAASLDLAYVAAGRLDGFWEFGLKPWDIAAGALLVLESGGMVGWPGGDYLASGDIVAGTPKVYDAMARILAPLVSSESA